MITISLDLLYSWINAFMWPFVRILAMIGAAPVLGESSIPARVKVALAALISVVVAPTLGPLPDIPPGSYTSILIVIQQVLIGIALGLVIRVAFAAVQTAGEFIGLQMGLSFASFFDPATGANTAVLSRLMNIIAMLVFLALDGHLILLSGVVNTFHILPISAPPSLNPNGLGILFEWSAQVMVAGMLLALPLLIILLTISLSMGILNRTAQQLSVFAVGFPVSLLVGLVLLAVVLPQTTPYLSQLFNESYEAAARMIYGFTPEN
ncbi:MAG TPA: flagellar biosynthetic protein FliR [Burkholderiaceae bacterium]|nr:flagellar biosynthetic protein FliR [Burkholderiaceae bacterium]